MFCSNRQTGLVASCALVALACSGEQRVQPGPSPESAGTTAGPPAALSASAETPTNPMESTLPPEVTAAPEEVPSGAPNSPPLPPVPSPPPPTPLPAPSLPLGGAAGSPQAGSSGQVASGGAASTSMGGAPYQQGGASGGIPTLDAGNEPALPTPESNAPCSRAETEASKAVVLEGMTAVMIRGGATTEEIKQYWGGPNGEYIQHNPIAPNGVETFAGFFAGGGGNYALSHLLGECDLVVTYGSYGGRATFDMLRVDPTVGRMVEHWDAGGGAVGGDTEVRDLELTGANRELVQNFIEDVLIEGNAGMASTYLSPNLTEHSSDISADGTSYSKIHHQVSEGNFVFTLSEGQSGNASRGFHDLFRIEGGVIVEHWGANLRVQAGASGEGIF